LNNPLIYHLFKVIYRGLNKFNRLFKPLDNKFLDCAVSSSAEYIISGDDHLLKLQKFKGIKILNPAEFIKMINKLKDQNV